MFNKPWLNIVKTNTQSLMPQNTSKPREKHIRGLCSCVYFTARYSYSWQSTEKFRNYYL